MDSDSLYLRLLELVRAMVVRLGERGVIPANLSLERLSVDPPRDLAHGELATNAAMVLARDCAMKPAALAELIGKEIDSCNPADLPPDLTISSWSVEGAGFLNFRLHSSAWHAVLKTCLTRGGDYGRSDRGQGQKINIEFVSANPTGPLHLAHARGAVVGDALAALLEFGGYSVTREYYINDAGAQVDTLARSLHHRYRQALAATTGETVGDLAAGLYPGDYLLSPAAELAATEGTAWIGKDESEWLPKFRAYAITAMMALIKSDLEKIEIHHDLFSSEAELVASGAVHRCLAALEKSGLIYQGTLEPPKGHKAGAGAGSVAATDDWEAREQTLFRSTQFGDDSDRALKKSDGSFTYFANDIAYHFDKIERGYDSLINIWGADHSGYVKRMKAAVKALSNDRVELDVKLCQMVSLLDQGAVIKMSKRAGTFVTLAEVVERVGAGVVRFIMLTRRNDMALDFDLALVAEQTRDNPVFYVQYAHARAASVLRAGSASGMDVSAASLAEATLSLLVEDEELALMRQIALWPRLVEQASEAHEPHRIAFYLGELAARFHSLWTKGRENAKLRFIQTEAPDATLARLALVLGMKSTLAIGLQILGVKPIEEMR